MILGKLIAELASHLLLQKGHPRGCWLWPSAKVATASGCVCAGPWSCEHPGRAASVNRVSPLSPDFELSPWFAVRMSPGGWLVVDF